MATPLREKLKKDGRRLTYHLHCFSLESLTAVSKDMLDKQSQRNVKSLDNA